MAKNKTALAIGDDFLSRANAVSLPLPDRMSFKRYVEGGAAVILIGRASPRWLADLLIWGEDHLGDKFSQAVSDLGISPKVAMNLIRVGRAVPPTRRRELLSFAHDEIVATLEPVEQTFWLNKAEKGDQDGPWTSKRLRSELRGLKGPQDDDSGTCPTCGKAGYKP